MPREVHGFPEDLINRLIFIVFTLEPNCSRNRKERFIMTKKLKRIFVGIMAAAICIVGSMSSISASAEDLTSKPWSASHVTKPGAPSSDSRIDRVVICHKAPGAIATCNYNSHTNPSATNGITTISCFSHAMSSVTINKTDSRTCKPSVGAPQTDIEVIYYVSAYTSSYNDIFWSKGNIKKK